MFELVEKCPHHYFDAHKETHYNRILVVIGFYKDVGNIGCFHSKCLSSTETPFEIYERVALTVQGYKVPNIT